MKLLAHQGTLFLVVRDGVEVGDLDGEDACVFDPLNGTLTEWQPAREITCSGTWFPYVEGDLPGVELGLGEAERV